MKQLTDLNVFLQKLSELSGIKPPEPRPLLEDSELKQQPPQFQRQPSAEELKEEERLHKRYVTCLDKCKFRQVEKYAHHHYSLLDKSASAKTSRKWVKRLASEFASLSNSLPINWSSSVCMRVLEDSVSKGRHEASRMLIASSRIT